MTEVLLVHPGGPFWRNKDIGAWSIPKGEYGAGENPEEVARREFLEELGIQMTNDLVPLGEVRQRGGKTVTAFAAEIDVDVQTIRSNTFEIEWPPRSGRPTGLSGGRSRPMVRSRIGAIEDHRGPEIPAGSPRNGFRESDEAVGSHPTAAINKC
jgi:8-oxo-dGTP pyrophosphatase MutT (NUDIX family)